MNEKVKPFLTNDKYNMTDLTFNDLLTEYKAIMEKFKATFHDYLYYESENVKQIRYQEYLIWFKKRDDFAREIADRLTA